VEQAAYMSSVVSTLDEAPPAINQAEDSPRRKGLPIWLRRWLHEPLLHFVLIGTGMFIAYSLIAPSAPSTSSNRIELTKGDLNQLQVSWMAQWQRPPTPDEMRGLIDDRVRQEILYREGLALGLDQGDEIIKRRMAQKMEFLAEDVSVSAPTPLELKAWFEKNSARFTLPGIITFQHLFFSPDTRGQQAKVDAERALAKLAGNSANTAALGDRFMFQDYYADSSPEQVAKVFGTQFSESLFKLKTGAWQGPIESGLGWHLVRIEAITPGRVPAFEEVDSSQLKSEWVSDQRAESKRQSFAVMKARYEIVLPK
jgi:hypothetical protein